MDGAFKKKLIEARRRGASFEELRELLKKARPDTRALAGAFAANVMAGLRVEGAGDEVLEAAADTDEVIDAKQCNQFVHYCNKGTTKESKTKNSPRLFRVDNKASEHEQINQLTDAIIKASEDGVRLEAVVYRPEFGELTLDCGHPGIKNPPPKVRSKGVGVQHALEERHKISPRDLAEALIKGKSLPHDKPSRLTIIHGRTKVIIEREMKAGSKRISETKAKIQTAMKEDS